MLEMFDPTLVADPLPPLGI